MQAKPAARELISAALARRAALLADASTTAIRLFHSNRDGEPGLVIERFGDALIVQVHEGQCTSSKERVAEICRCVMDSVGAKSVYLKRFALDRSGSQARLEAEHRSPQPFLGVAADAEFHVLEKGLRFLVRPYDGYSVGLFLDQRENRRRVRERSHGRNVLNLFSYTGAFTVAAAAGGATSTVSVDVSKRYLEWSRQNLAANGQPLDHHTFICSDVFSYFKRARRQGKRFDLLIVDPPTFGRSKQTGETFSIESDLPALVEHAIELATPGAWMLFATNHRGTSVVRLESAVLRAGTGRRLKIVERPELPGDFAGDHDFMKSLWCRVN